MKLGTGRYAEFLRRLLSLNDDSLTGRHVSPDLVPVLQLDSRPEYAYLTGERICGGSIEIPNIIIAGNWGHAFLVNPSGSNALVILEAILLLNEEAVQVDALIALTTAAVIGTPDSAGTSLVRDSRWKAAVGTGYNLGAAQVGEKDAAAALSGLVLAVVRLAANGDGSYDGPVVLAPGDAVMVLGSAAEQSLTASFIWRERAQGQYERRG